MLTEKEFYDEIIGDLFNKVVSSLLGIKELSSRLVDLIAFYFDIMSIQLREWLFQECNKEKAISKIIIGAMTKSNYKASEDMVPLIGKEGYILILSISQKSLSLQIERLIDDKFDWNLLWRYILEFEKQTMTNISNQVISLCNLDPKKKNTSYIKFRQKLLMTIIENKIKRAIRNSMKRFDELVDMIDYELDLSSIDAMFRSSIHQNDILRIVSGLIRRNYIFLSRYRHPGYYKPTMKLLGEIPPENNALTYDKVFEILEGFFIRYSRDSNAKDRAYKIAEKIRPHVQGKSPNGITAGILNYLKKDQSIFCSINYIAKMTKVNPATVNQMYKVIKSLEKYFN